MAGVTAYALRRQPEVSRQPGPVEEAFWQTEFSQLDGATLPMASFRGQNLLVNFWATWCPPCVAELPLLSAFHNENKPKNWQVLGLAVDQPSAVKRFQAQNPLSFPVALAGMDGTEISRSLGNLSGGLPFTVVFSPAGAVVHRKIGRVSPDDLAAWVQAG
ncbi:TlpA family protein disulfide reductase [Rhodoferax antarcticus]|uniref:TlpA family protein disulfide reductase n=1 Tax=Rhodoferax antarcticus TaxID=81479 RepID=UPI0023790A77|nr:TlpA disulfide reductase family protein [Rhodoferax antarcticus]